MLLLGVAAVQSKNPPGGCGLFLGGVRSGFKAGVVSTRSQTRVGRDMRTALASAAYMMATKAKVLPAAVQTL